MIVEALLQVVVFILKIVLSVINLPDFPVEITSSVESYIDMVFDNVNLFGLLAFFVRPATLKIAATTFVTVFRIFKGI